MTRLGITEPWHNILRLFPGKHFVLEEYCITMNGTPEPDSTNESASDSIASLHERSGTRLAACVAEMIEGEEFSSPGVIDLIVWNVVVSFFVNLAASASYTRLSKVLVEHGRIDRRHLRDASSEISMPVTVFVSGDRRRACRELVRLSLRQQGIPEQKLDALTDRMMEIMSERKEF